MDPIPLQDGPPKSPNPDNVKTPDKLGDPFIEDLFKTQTEIDQQLDTLYKEVDPRLDWEIDIAKENTRVFHKQETDILGTDGKPTGNKRIVIISSRGTQLRDGENGRYYAFIVYEPDNPNIVTRGLLRLIFDRDAGGYLDTDKDLFKKGDWGNKKAVDFQTQETGGVFNTISGKIDRNEIVDPSDLHETTYGEVYLVDGSKQKMTLFDAAFQKSKDQVQRMLEKEPERIARIEAGAKEIERQADELDAQLKAEAEAKKTASSTPLDKPKT